MKSNLSVFILSLGLFLVIFIKTSRSSEAQNTQNLEQYFLKEIIDQRKYDSRIIPSSINNHTDPTLVFTNFFIRRISPLDDFNQEMSIEVTFRQLYNDPRLKFHAEKGGPQYVTLSLPHIVWQPDTFFTNEITGYFHNIITPNLYYRIFPSGDVLYSHRINLKLTCPMYFKYFPMDYQICMIRLASYAYTEDDIILLWKKGDPVQIVRNLNHITLGHYYSLKKFATGHCTAKTTTDVFSCLRTDLLFQRNLRPFIYQVYIPSGLLIIVSWLAFWIDPNEFNTRLILSLVCLICMCFHVRQFQFIIPVTSYIKAIDVWTGVCFMFLFGNVIDIILLNHYFKKEKQEIPESENVNPENESTILRWFRGNTHFEKSEKFSLISIPVGFFGFNLIYWIFYLNINELDLGDAGIEQVTSYNN